MRNPILESVLFNEINTWKEKMHLQHWQIRIAFLNKLYASHNGYVNHDRNEKKAIFYYDASLPVEDLITWVSYQMRTITISKI